MPGRGDLIDEALTLDFWVGADDEPLRHAELSVSRDDACSFTETGDTFLVNKEYEGYMGNYGDTLDYWYRRAALVVQTPLAVESARFKTDFDAALADALVLARSGRADELAQRLQAAVHPLNAAARAQDRSLLAAYAELAAALPDAVQAKALCVPFDWRQFQPDDAPALGRLAQRWGAPWMHELMQAWAQPVIDRRRHSWSWASTDDNAPWPQPLLPFIQACQRAPLGEDVVNGLLAQCQAALIAPDAASARARPAQRQATLPHRLGWACELASALSHAPTAAAQSAALLHHVGAHPTLYPLLQLAPLLQALPGDGAPAEARQLRTAVVQALKQALAPPLPDDSDHRIEGIEWVCRCADCAPVIAWAASPGAAPLTLPMAEPRRQHVQEQLNAAAAPFAVDTLKQGRPYSLIIHKPADLHQRLRAQRQAWAEQLAELESTVG